ncbi:glycosyltransferase family 2 protein [Geobacter pelophilus]|jgi:hypothetical protein|uniref:Glycosyltransferase family 2 protein n=1 Tax=Geoanaerobacter pelophilus TaxID=60036 RepID=A0AAW4L5W8_9BACT|nr:DUF2304 family protein [Geoanaerobacter pelophilus]MBT0666298.1 glycosyltransferase family 2 protein [Geoanaerobacter pelophilus]
MYFEKIQAFSLLFSLIIFTFIFGLVQKRRVKEEYSILWFLMSIFFIYLSLDKHAIDRFGDLFGVAYKPSILMLFTTAFTFLVLIHVSIIITKLSDQNKELIQELGLGNLIGHYAREKNAEILVIVPAYNEEASIAEVIADLRSNQRPLDIIVVNDGSIDRTSAIARLHGVAVIDLPKNLGIGGAVQAGFKYADRLDYQVAIQFDGDGQHIASEIEKLLATMDEKKANVVIGSRFIGWNEGYRSTFVRRFGIHLFDAVNSILIGQRVTDNTSGFRAYDSRAISFLASHYPIDYPEPEAVILLGRNGFKLAESSICMRERQGGTSSISSLGAIYYMVKVLLAIVMTALRKPIISVD